MAESKGFFLASVADLHHVADAADQLDLIGFAFVFQEFFEERGGIEMVFDGAFASASDDDDVLDAGGNAFLNYVLDLRLVDHREHFFGLGFGGG